MDEVDANFLPIVYEILKGVDKESFDLSGKTSELRAKLQQAREQIEKLPGIDSNPDDQKKQIEVLRKQLEIKTDLLKKYRDNQDFDLK